MSRRIKGQRIDWKGAKFNKAKQAAIFTIDLFIRRIKGEANDPIIPTVHHYVNSLLHEAVSVSTIHGLLHAGEKYQGFFYRLGFDGRNKSYNNVNEEDAIKHLEKVKAHIESLENYEQGLIKNRDLHNELQELIPDESGSLTDVTISIPESLISEEIEDDPGRIAEDAINKYKKEIFSRIQYLLEYKKNMILAGVPGTGKTYLALEYAEEKFTENNILFLQFHPSYSYEEFIEGYIPKEEGTLTFKLKRGKFLEFLIDKVQKSEEPFLLIVDEINRGNIPQIFGELLYCLEYRNQKEIPTLYSNMKITIPNNLFIIGTMNTADRSIALMDYALRRRFAIMELNPNTDLLKDWLIWKGIDINFADSISTLLENVNNQILKQNFSKNHRLGHSYFMHDDLTIEKAHRIWNNEIIPMLEELCFGNLARLRKILEFTDLYKETGDDFRIGFKDFKNKVIGISE